MIHLTYPNGEEVWLGSGFVVSRIEERDSKHGAGFRTRVIYRGDYYYVRDDIHDVVNKIERER